MADVNHSIDLTIMHEDATLSGVISKDEGGITKWGIASGYNPGVNVELLTLDQAKEIYRNKYATPFHLELIADQVVLDMVFDCLVNPGPGAGAKIVQQAINHYFNKQVLAEDGCIGMDTITRMNGIPSSELLPRIRASRCQYYFRVASSRGQSIYLYGWLIRACS